MTEPQNAFPPAGIDGFLSHFIFTVRINKGELAGEVFSYTWPASIQTVVRSEPFIYEGPQAGHRVEFDLPDGTDLPRTLTEDEFIAVPTGFLQPGKETIWLQILNLDARGQTDYGPMRCILGATFKREYPDIFQASFGAAQSVGERGLPARLFFNPNGIFETPFGSLHTRPKALLGTRIDQIPPVGSNPEMLGSISLDSVEDMRASNGTLPEPPTATLIALAHPIDARLQGEERELYELVEKAIART